MLNPVVSNFVSHWSKDEFRSVHLYVGDGIYDSGS